jgi:hypothetical protein
VVEVEVDDGPVATVKRFRGRQVLRHEIRGGLRALSFRIFATADWSRLSSPREDASVWEDPQTCFPGRPEPAAAVTHHR